jgi:hypothetical protein
VPDHDPYADAVAALRALADHTNQSNGHHHANGNPFWVDWPEFWARENGDEEWIAWPLVPVGRQVALYARAKAGKSWVSLNVAAAIATGRPVFGRPAGPIRHVAYFDWEMTVDDLFERLDQFGYTEDDDLGHFHYALQPDLPALNTPKGAELILSRCAEVEAEVAFIDTLGRAISGEENSADSYRDFARTTGVALKRRGVAVVRTDHAGKSDEAGQRGSSAKDDDVDIVYRLEQIEGGWNLIRTFARVGWAPARARIERHTDDEDTITFVIATRDDPSFPVGTAELATQLEHLGVTTDMGRRTAMKMLKDATGHGVKDSRLGHALRWLRTAEPAFNASPSTRGNVGHHSPDGALWITDANEGVPPSGTTSAHSDLPGGTISGHQGAPPVETQGVHPPPLRSNGGAPRSDDTEPIF